MGFLYIIVKIAVKVISNVILPGTGIAFELAEAGKSFFDGDFIGGGICLASATFDAATMGSYSCAKEVANLGGKQAAIDATRKAVNEASKTLGQEASKNVGKQLGRNLAKDLASGMVEETTERCLRDLTNVTVGSTVREVARGGISSGGKDEAEEMFKSGFQEILTGVLTKDIPQQTFKSPDAQAAVLKFASSVLTPVVTNQAMVKDSFAVASGALNLMK